jgi:hypothetical protein
MAVSERTAREWYENAARSYVEKHQGCPWCGGAHCVHQVHKDDRHEYCCLGCDFRAGFDRKTGNYFHVPGENHVQSGKTMMANKTMMEI